MTEPLPPKGTYPGDPALGSFRCSWAGALGLEVLTAWHQHPPVPVPGALAALVETLAAALPSSVTVGAPMF